MRLNTSKEPNAWRTIDTPYLLFKVELDSSEKKGKNGLHFKSNVSVAFGREFNQPNANNNALDSSARFDTFCFCQNNQFQVKQSEPNKDKSEERERERRRIPLDNEEEHESSKNELQSKSNWIEGCKQSDESKMVVQNHSNANRPPNKQIVFSFEVHFSFVSQPAA